MSQPKANSKSQGRVDRLKNLVQEKNAHVILCNNPETYALVELGIELDKAVKRLRNRTFTSIPAEDAMPVFEKISRSLVELESAIRSAAEITDMTYYRTPRTIRRFQQQLNMNHGKNYSESSENVVNITDTQLAAKNRNL